MKISFDPAKRDWTLLQRGLDFVEAAMVFAAPVYEKEDLRFDYGEMRIITVGHLRGRMVIVVWTPRGPARHVISMRKANEREEKAYADRIG